jgi:hypothetical protein
VTRWLAVLMVVAAAPADGRVVVQPPALIEFDACVLPNDACTDRHDVVKLIVHGSTHQMAVTNLTVLNSGRTRGEVLSDITFRPQRALGSKELLAPFVPGARLHVRATTRRGGLELFMQTVEPWHPPQPPKPPTGDEPR